jgi:hypothetical protein
VPGLGPPWPAAQPERLAPQLDPLAAAGAGARLSGHRLPAVIAHTGLLSIAAGWWGDFVPQSEISYEGLPLLARSRPGRPAGACAPASLPGRFPAAGHVRGQPAPPTLASVLGRAGGERSGTAVPNRGQLQLPRARGSALARAGPKVTVLASGYEVVHRATSCEPDRRTRTTPGVVCAGELRGQHRGQHALAFSAPVAAAAARNRAGSGRLGEPRCARHDSNMRPLPPQGSALSPELRAREGQV